jgi:general secretion pathway protein G
MMIARPLPTPVPQGVQGAIRLQQGFTLIEIMVVIVIVSILAAMIGMSVNGSEARRVAQERDQLQDSIAEIHLESLDQGRMLGLVALLQTAAAPARYAVVQFDPSEQNKDKRWRLAPDFKVHDLPSGVNLSITVLQDSTRANQSTALDRFKSDSALNPQMVWFGNGEATAARLQLSQDGQPVGDAVETTALGRVLKDDSKDLSNTSSRGDQ